MRERGDKAKDTGRFEHCPSHTHFFRVSLFYQCNILKPFYTFSLRSCYRTNCNLLQRPPSPYLPVSFPILPVFSSFSLGYPLPRATSLFNGRNLPYLMIRTLDERHSTAWTIVSLGLYVTVFYKCWSF